MSMDKKPPDPPIPASTPDNGKQRDINKIAEGMSDLQKRIQAKLAEKARTDALIRALEEKAERERKEKKPEETEKQKTKTLEEDREENPFKHFIINNMHDTAFSCIYSKTKNSATLEDINKKSSESGREVKFWNFQDPHRILFF